ncbi:hypothetical protein [Streptomyces iranensis]|uniref:Uncharacterized protein n=1 Tax=Streptomyces iranensis TaxID=576784 RepID=A0A061A884_9ACTN|nr:hypothetical protein [Streptomyces iranensis]MBP2060191.1 hypothetical protein [Streptomyces iranensis]CDR13684.1 predicted protein [Streptomyces iranensis]
MHGRITDELAHHEDRGVQVVVGHAPQVELNTDEPTRLRNPAGLGRQGHRRLLGFPAELTPTIGYVG